MAGDPVFGPRLTGNGVEFRLWAPAAKSVEVTFGHDAVAMERSADGWFSREVPDCGVGTQYRFRIDGDLAIPDPASRFQPDDVSGPSEVIDHAAYPWKNGKWVGRPWQEASIVEIHVGTFTEAGTFRSTIDKLDHLAKVGFTAVELMPLADFPGRWNWGYDGVLWFAPDSAYGRPDDLKALVEAAHDRGLMIFLDVVYNHFGPEGNYLPRIAPPFFSDAQTPWGRAINYEIPEVRTFAVENAISWLRDYRFDGLRLDAVHAISTPGVPNILHEISEAVGVLARDTDRHVHLILENDDNRVSLLAPNETPPQGHYRAQWNDDYHHAWHARLTGETTGYYTDYVECDRLIARTLAEGFGYQGERSTYRKGVARGEPSKGLSPLAFINFLQNHDQIGNRALGDRLTSLVPPAALEAALILLLLSPSPPMLFMGEEWGSERPFPFFCDFGGGLADAVRNGRRKEFADAYADPDLNVPDPLAEATVRSATLDWDAIESGGGHRRLQLVSALMHARQQHVARLLPHIVPARSTAEFKDGLLVARWQTHDRALLMTGNFSSAHREKAPGKIDTYVWNEHLRDHLAPWSVTVGIGPA
ncbi:MAG: malto-oligosyltrehalose trehalohydrolase [Pseudolabrys sp.]|nr:malto-oligosyltrehalose trehalohydrolase [Pseudolabrys sp.]